MMIGLDAKTGELHAEEWIPKQPTLFEESTKGDNVVAIAK